MSDKQVRRRLFVDPTFQGRLLLRLVAYWAIYHVALWHLMFFFVLMSNALSHDPAIQSKSLGTLYWEFAGSHVSIIVCFLVMLPILGRDLVRFSHRLAGPLVRLGNVLDEMAQGKPVAPVRLRRSDLPSHFVDAFNQMVVVWNERIGAAPPAPAATDADLQLVDAD